MVFLQYISIGDLYMEFLQYISTLNFWCYVCQPSVASRPKGVLLVGRLHVFEPVEIDVYVHRQNDTVSFRGDVGFR